MIPRVLLDKLEANGKDDAFGVVANRAVGFEETSTTPTSRTLVIQFDPGVNYIQILGTKSIEPKITQTLPSPSDATAKLKVPITESKLPLNGNTSQSDGSLVSTVPGSSVPSKVGSTLSVSNLSAALQIRGVSLTILPGASVQGNANYYPNAVSVKNGNKIIVTNRDTVPHTVTSGIDHRM